MYLEVWRDRRHDLVDVLQDGPGLRPHGQENEVEAEDGNEHEGGAGGLHRRGLAGGALAAHAAAITVEILVNLK